jgi:tetratricopeptide (TPR) repeat protein
MNAQVTLTPTPNQTFRIEGSGDYDFRKVLHRTEELQHSGAIDEACNLRYHAFQRLVELIPDDEETLLEWAHPNTQAALQLLYGSAVDHFLIDDFELSAAMLEFLLDLDPEDHEEATWLLCFDYIALSDFDSFEERIDDLSEKRPEQCLLRLWAAYQQHGSLPPAEVRHLQEHFRDVYREFTADLHTADATYLHDIESEHPSSAAQARELWLKTETLWRLHPDFIAALKQTDK